MIIMNLRPDRLEARRISALTRHEASLEAAKKARDVVEKIPEPRQTQLLEAHRTRRKQANALVDRIALTVKRTEENLDSSAPHTKPRKNAKPQATQQAA